MRHLMFCIALQFAAGCAVVPAPPHSPGDVIGLNSFALAARYGTPESYQHQGEYFQLNYGSDAAGCRVIVLLDQTQRVAGWASSGAKCDALPHRADIP